MEAGPLLIFMETLSFLCGFRVYELMEIKASSFGTMLVLGFWLHPLGLYLIEKGSLSAEIDAIDVIGQFH